MPAPLFLFPLPVMSPFFFSGNWRKDSPFPAPWLSEVLNAFFPLSAVEGGVAPAYDEKTVPLLSAFDGRGKKFSWANCKEVPSLFFPFIEMEAFLSPERVNKRSFFPLFAIGSGEGEGTSLRPPSPGG